MKAKFRIGQTVRGKRTPNLYKVNQIRFDSGGVFYRVNPLDSVGQVRQRALVLDEKELTKELFACRGR